MTNTYDILLHPKKIEESQLTAIDELFRRSELDPSMHNAIFLHLHSFFKNAAYDSQIIATHYRTYWKWYVLSTWRNLLAVDKSDIPIVFSKQLVSAVILDQKIMDNFLFYLYKRALTKQEMESIFLHTREQVLTETLPINPAVLKDTLTPQMIVKMLSSPSRAGSIEVARLLSEMERQLFTSHALLEDLPSHARADILDEYKFILNSFQLIDDIEDVVEKYISDLDDVTNADGLEKESIANFGKRNESLSQENNLPKQQKDKTQNSTRTMQMDKDKHAASKPPSTSKISAISPSSTSQPSKEKKSYMSYTQIKTMIESRFRMGTDGRFVNIEGVLMLLDNLADEQKDEQIRELYYFDEQEGKFAWNKELFHGS